MQKDDLKTEKMSVGSGLTSKDDKLSPISEDQLYGAIKSPREELSLQIRNLRNAKSVSMEAYGKMKRSLPYFVCATFNPPFRKTDHFASTRYFVMDVDKISSKELEIGAVRKKVQNDPRVLMCFVSPGEDGLKILFRLKTRCMDAGKYKAFYSKFVQDFSMMYGLEQIVDSKTCDVTRACFLSVDPDIYYNKNCEEVDWENYVDWENVAESLSLFKKAERSILRKADDDEAEEESHAPVDPTEEVLADIKARLFPNRQKKRTQEKEVYVPEVLNDIISELNKFLTENNLKVVEIRNIQYGKKIKVSLGLKMAEANLFFGRRGFSVVQSPKSGTNEELNGVLVELIELFLDSYGGKKQEFDVF